MNKLCLIAIIIGYSCLNCSQPDRLKINTLNTDPIGSTMPAKQDTLRHDSLIAETRRLLDEIQTRLKGPIEFSIGRASQLQISNVSFFLQSNEIIKRLGVPIRTEESKTIRDAGTQTTRHYFFDKSYLHVVPDYPAIFMTYNPLHMTPDGLHPGSNFDAIRVAFPDVSAISNGIIWVESDSGGFSLILIVDKGLITAMMLKAASG
jgi:hypothetical protein